MRHWARARLARTCGKCGELIQRGDAILVYEIAASALGKGVRLIRCGPCEGGAPADLPTAADSPPAAALEVAQVMTRLGLLPLDFSARRLGERDPGEDDR